jgi:peptidoglycan hydrolase-like protein with peptidoglycan-binding domain
MHGLTTSAKADTVSDVQNILNQLGYNAGPVDGAYGGKTRGALEKFYKDTGSIYDGQLDDNEVNDLQNALDYTGRYCEAHPLNNFGHNTQSKDFDFSQNFITIATNIPAFQRGTAGTLLNNAETDYTDTDPYIVAVGDINLDGISDLMVDYIETQTPPIILIGTSSGKFISINLGEEATRRHIREGQFIDLNQDSYPDFVGFTTSDHVEYFERNGIYNLPVGEPDIILMNKRGENFDIITPPEAYKNDVNHGGLISDINADGLIDIISLTESEGKATYPILQLKNNNFQLSDKPLPQMVTDHWIEDGEAGDLNGDGIDDYVISLEVPSFNRDASFDLAEHIENHRTLLVIYGDGDRDFSDNKSFTIGEYWFNVESLAQIVQSNIGKESKVETLKKVPFGTANIELIDINDDGRLDIVEGQFIADWSTSGLQVYLNNLDCFRNATHQFFPNQRANRIASANHATKYINNFYFDDINDDQLKDLVIQSLPIWSKQADIGEENYPFIFLQDENGSFLPTANANVLELLDISNIVIGDFNGDGQNDLAGIEVGANSPRIKVFLKSEHETKVLDWHISLSDEGYKTVLEGKDIFTVASDFKIINKSHEDITKEGVQGREELLYQFDEEFITIKGTVTLVGNERVYLNFREPIEAGQAEIIFGPLDKLIISWKD